MGAELNGLCERSSRANESKADAVPETLHCSLVKHIRWRIDCDDVEVFSQNIVSLELIERSIPTKSSLTRTQITVEAQKTNMQ